jgi:hypothetical protein
MFVAPSGKTNNTGTGVTASRHLSTSFVTTTSHDGRLSTPFPRSSRRASLRGPVPGRGPALTGVGRSVDGRGHNETPEGT